MTRIEQREGGEAKPSRGSSPGVGGGEAKRSQGGFPVFGARGPAACGCHFIGGVGGPDFQKFSKKCGPGEGLASPGGGRGRGDIFPVFNVG